MIKLTYLSDDHEKIRIEANSKRTRAYCGNLKILDNPHRCSIAHKPELYDRVVHAANELMHSKASAPEVELAIDEQFRSINAAEVRMLELWLGDDSSSTAYYL
jgi:hypothetical protein